MPHAFATTLKTFKTASGKTGSFYSLPELTKPIRTSPACRSRCASSSSRCCATATARR